MSATHEDEDPSRTVLPMQGQARRFEHVLLHLYALDERWDMLVRELPSALRARAIEAGCSGEAVRSPRTASFRRSTDACQQVVLADHDRLYAPQYLASVRTALRLRRHAAQLSPPGHVYVGDNGVLTVADTVDANKGHVHTAFRVKPKGLPLHAVRQEDYVTAAVNRMKDLTVFKAPGPRGARS